ncbi:MAG: prolyl oligopeptidase family serine peptidase [Bacteroidota bacterium]
MFKKLSFLLVGIAIVSCKKKVETTYYYPSIENDSTVVEKFNESYTNQFNNLENFKDPSVSKWYVNQDTLAESYFKRNKFKDFQNNINSLFPEGTTSTFAYKPVGNNEYFYLESTEDSTLLKKVNIKTKEKTSFLGFPTSDEIYYYQPSLDSKMAWIILTQDGKDKILIYDLEELNLVATVDEDIDTNAFAWAAWTKDYTHLAFTGFPSNEDSKNSYIGLLDMETKEVTKILQNGKNDIDFNPEFFVVPEVSTPDSDYLIVYVANASEHYDGYYMPYEEINTGAKWKKLFSQQDSILYYGIERRGEYYYSRYKNGEKILAKSALDSIGINEKVIYKKPEGINFDSFVLSKDNVYLTLNKNGLDSKLVHLKDDIKIDTVELDYPIGQISFYESNPSMSDIIIRTDNWTTNSSVYDITDNLEITKNDYISKHTPQEFNDLTYTLVDIESHDGTKVPLTIIHKDGFVTGGDNKAVIMAYGAYQLSREPEFQSAILNFVNAGNIYAIAHVRGGGEKGYDWFIDGIKDKKSNSWKDVLASAHYLKSNNYFGENRLGLFFQSAGGISCGMALMEEPELFNAVVGIAPFLNPIRIEHHTSYNASDRFYDFGTIQEEQGFKDLMAMDPIVNLDGNKEFPPSLMIIGDDDDLVPLYDPAKYIALLQSKDSVSTKPFLLDVYKDEGHYVPYDEVHEKAFMFFDRNL